MSRGDRAAVRIHLSSPPRRERLLAFLARQFDAEWHLTVSASKLSAALSCPSAMCQTATTSANGRALAGATDARMASARMTRGMGGHRAFRDSLKKSQHLVRGVVLCAGQAGPLDNDLLALPWGWMVEPVEALFATAFVVTGVR